jgi:hypothetical protein
MTAPPPAGRSTGCVADSPDAGLGNGVMRASYTSAFGAIIVA